MTDNKKPCILHFHHGTKNARELFRVVACSAMDNSPLLVRLCYTCEKWWTKHDVFVDHIASHDKEMPSVGLGEWTNPDHPELLKKQVDEFYRRNFAMRMDSKASDFHVEEDCTATK